MKKYKYRDAITGKFVTENFSSENRKTTIKESLKNQIRIKEDLEMDKSLLELTKDLFVISESDYPFQLLNDDVKFLSIYEFFEKQINLQDNKRDQLVKLFEYLNLYLRNIFILKIGNESKNKIYIFGQDSKGQIKGLFAYIVET